MKSTGTPNLTEIQRTTHVMKLTWLALIGGQLGGAFFLLFYSPPIPQPIPEFAPNITVALCIILAVLIPLGYFIRMQTYKKGWKSHRITPQAYVFANLLLLSLMLAVYLVAIIGAFLTSNHTITLIPAGIALVIQLVNFPTGAPMQMQPPSFIKDQDASAS
ncbi:hypothetical protein [Poriferisphaera sp. WC338]|uniref:hypothetical protein n=1 Tax=Poriferisphaera sp. WC338 TaxID=3425129 RepID=UPI003D813B2A